MTPERNVWVFVEQSGATIAPVSLELVSKARELADELGSEVHALLPGDEVAALAPDLVHYGADRVLLAEHPELAVYRSMPYARVAIDLVTSRRPYIFLFGATPVGRDLAPRVASAVSAGLTADCTALQIGAFERGGVRYEDLLFQICPGFSGNVIATIVNREMHPQMATVREGVMRPHPPDGRRQGVIERIEPRFGSHELELKVLKREVRLPDVDLKNARIIVAGGIGVGSREGFALIRQLAEVLGGEVAASRAAVDAGFVSHVHLVGQTGLTVRPRLYIACGISGAMQHRAGMDQAKKIVAINTDPQAPIFDVAHYRIVGDLHSVIPQMIQAYRDTVRDNQPAREDKGKPNGG